jgi:AraC-like DNA-binding protein
MTVRASRDCVKTGYPTNLFLSGSFRANAIGLSMSISLQLDVGQTPGVQAERRAAGAIPFVRANALTPFFRFLNELGAPVDRFCQQARMPRSHRQEPEALLPVFSCYRFIELAARQEKLEDIGVLVGQRASSFDLGAYGAALRGTSTVYEYLQIGVSLIGGHSSGTRLWLQPQADVLRVNQHLIGPSSTGRCIGDLYTLILTISTLRQFFGPTWSPGEVRLLAGTEVFLGDRDIFGDASLITGQRFTSFTVSRPLMQTLVHYQCAGAAPGQHTRLGESQPIPTDFRSSAEQLILSLLSDGYAGIQTTAEAAGTSPRTLQRRLAEAGVTYAELLAASRLRTAKEWLTTSDMPIAEMSSALGYTAATNFARAFRRQTGLSPAAYRRTRYRTRSGSIG